MEVSGAPDDTAAQPTCERQRVIASTGRRNKHMVREALDKFGSFQTFGVPVTQLPFVIATWETDGKQSRQMAATNRILPEQPPWTYPSSTACPQR